jgi:hypothetical protein
MVLRLTLLMVLAFHLPGCGGSDEPEIQAGVDVCKNCNMVISQTNQAAATVQDGDFHTFCNPLCLLKDLAKHGSRPGTDRARFLFADFETGSLMGADTTYFLLTENLTTVMRSGVLCFGSEAQALSYQRAAQEVVTDWRGFWVKRGTPHKTIQVILEKSGLSPEVIVVDKNDIVELILTNDNPTRGYTFTIKGYEEVGVISLPDGTEKVRVRFLANKPGIGFPIINHENKSSVGMLRVLGAHTADEETL